MTKALPDNPILRNTDKICLRCSHLNNGEHLIHKRICICKNPILMPANLLSQYSISELRNLKDAKERFNTHLDTDE